MTPLCSSSSSASHSARRVPAGSHESDLASRPVPPTDSRQNRGSAFITCSEGASHESRLTHRIRTRRGRDLARHQHSTYPPGLHRDRIQGHELGHVHPDRGTLDMPLPDDRRAEVLNAARAKEWFSGWVSKPLSDDAAAQDGIALLRGSYDELHTL